MPGTPDAPVAPSQETPPEASASETAEALRIAESIHLEEGALAPDGTAHLHILRPCVGKGRGSHLYEAEMLKENASKFGGWKMYLNHDSPEARKARRGLPRDVEDLGGRVIESWWDPNVPADPERGIEQGAVVGKVKPVLTARKIIEEDPALIEASINAHATAVKPVTRDGKRVWLVEGIEDKGSVDWVTEAGAGGRVASLIEASYHRTRKEEETDLLETLTDQELLEHLRETRPELVESLATEKTPEADPKEEKVPEAKQETTETAEPRSAADLLAEALETDEGREALEKVIADRVEKEVTDKVSETEDKLEEALREERDLFKAEENGRKQRERQIHSLRESAHSLIDEAKLPDGFAEDLKKRYEVDADGKPTATLDVLDKLDDEGEIVESAEDRLRESVNKDVTRARELIASVNPSRVRGQGQTTTTVDEESGEKVTTGPKPLHSGLLQEAGFDPDDDLWNDE